MKTKYKILIISVMVLSILACFAITSFAAYTTTDITYNNNTYTYKNIISSGVQARLQIWDYDKIYYDNQGVLTELNYDYIILSYIEDNGNYNNIIDFVNNGQAVATINETNPTNIIINGANTKIAVANSSAFDNSRTNLNTSNTNEYMIWQNNDMANISFQVNILNNTQPNPLEKVDDFLTYLSTSLNKLTTMILANQILILFIVAVPVVSFVIGSFKRIKDSGRV